MPTPAQIKRKTRTDRSNANNSKNPVLSHMRSIAYAPVHIDQTERDAQQAMHDAQAKRERRAEKRKKP